MNKISKLLLLILLLILIGIKIKEESNNINELEKQNYTQSYESIYLKIFTNDSPFSKEDQNYLHKYSKLFYVLRSVIPKYHLLKEREALDFNTKFINIVISELDPEFIIFSTEDIKRLQNNHPWSLVRETNCLLLFLDIYQEYIKKIKAYQDSVLTYSYNNNSSKLNDERSDTNQSLINSWKLKLTKRINNQIIAREKEKVPSSVIVTFVKNQLIDQIDDLKIDLSKKIYGSIISGYLQMYDPHSNYYLDNEALSSFASNKTLGYGFSFRLNNKMIPEITSILKKSSAYKANIKENDLIIKIINPKTKEVFDPTKSSLKKISKFIDNSSSNKIELILKSAVSKKEYKAFLEKELIIDDSKVIGKHILKSTQTNDKIAYLDIPLFYTDLAGKQKDIEDDFAIEIHKINELKIKNLIIDLRNNGGGSFNACLAMLSHFIENGPLIQIKDNKNEVSISYVKEKKELFKGNVIILINEYSASASEIFAATMQDYNRAILIGSNQSYGKGSVQTVIDFNQVNRMLVLDGQDPIDDEILGFLKLTTQQIYRISGKSTQKEGVHPDILFFMPYPNPSFKQEKDLTFGLSYNEIKKENFQPYLIKNKELIIKEITNKYKNNKFILENNKIYKDYIQLMGQANAVSLNDIKTINSQMEKEIKEINNENYTAKNFTTSEVELSKSFMIDTAVDTLLKMESKK